ncbi:hypothetical protein AUP68_06433 [Ilyonectria robusta]
MSLPICLDGLTGYRPGYSVADPQSTVPNGSISESTIVDTEIDTESPAESRQIDPESPEATNAAKPYDISQVMPPLTEDQQLANKITEMLKDDKDYLWDDICHHFPGMSKQRFRRTWYSEREHLKRLYTGKLSRLSLKDPRRGKVLTIYVGGGDRRADV